MTARDSKGRFVSESKAAEAVPPTWHVEADRAHGLLLFALGLTSGWLAAALVFAIAR